MSQQNNFRNNNFRNRQNNSFPARSFEKKVEEPEVEEPEVEEPEVEEPEVEEPEVEEPEVEEPEVEDAGSQKSNNFKTGVVVNCKRLNLRSSPVKENDENILTELDAATQVKVLDEKEEWYYVRVEKAPLEYTGYVMKKFIIIKRE